MKIALLTLSPSHNYGGILQAVALYSYLESLGHEVTLINKKLHQSRWKEIFIKILEIVPFQNIKQKRLVAKKTTKLKLFVDSYLPRKSEKIISVVDLRCLIEGGNFDAVVVGSDQVWRYQYIKDGHHDVYFLGFQSSRCIKKIAYAASFGKDEWEEPGCISEISSFLKQFDAISTREKSGVSLCQNTFNVLGVENTLDPTMLVGSDFYDKYLVGLPGAAQGKILVTYILDESESKKTFISEVKAALEADDDVYKQINLSDQEFGGFYSVEQWLWYIKNSDFVVTDSFHGMVFSILFGKQFIVIGNRERGLSRFLDLLESLNLNDRLVLLEQVHDVCLPLKIDFNEVNKRLSVLRNSSESFLRKSLSE